MGALRDKNKASGNSTITDSTPISKVLVIQRQSNDETREAAENLPGRLGAEIRTDPNRFLPPGSYEHGDITLLVRPGNDPNTQNWVNVRTEQYKRNLNDF